MKPEPETESV